MKVIESSIIPFKGYKAINLFGVIFHRKDASPMKEVDLNHEAIHTEQMKELWYIGFYLLYLFEWIFKVLVYLDFYKAYREIRFEKESYSNQNDLDYIKRRQKFNWINY